MQTFMVPCLLGLEKLVGDEIRRLGLRDVQVENGRVLCRGQLSDIARLNINLRCGARVLLVLGRFPARSFEELFQGTRAIAWEDYLPRDAAFPVKGYSISSQLHAVPACQSIIKKAMVERMKAHYGLEQFPEDGVKHQVRFSLFKDEAMICLDTSGEGLYKRGYRAVGVEAPLRETLAAAMVTLSRFRGRDPFCDPFCGSGTICIEAALIALNRAPGLDRSFDAQRWALCPPGTGWLPPGRPWTRSSTGSTTSGAAMWTPGPWPSPGTTPGRPGWRMWCALRWRICGISAGRTPMASW